jgi:hypothetical protein
MSKKSNSTYISFSYLILFVFVLLEVIYFDSGSDFNTVISYLEILFILIVFILNPKIGIMYYLSFNILTFGEWSYVLDSSNPQNFYGIRIFDISVSTLLGFILFLLSIFNSKVKFKDIINEFEFKFFHYFILFTFLIGIINLLLGNNYFDNFISDLKTYLPFYFFAYFVFFIKPANCLKVLKYSLYLTFISFLLSFILDQRFYYDSNNSYLLMNSVSYLFPVFFIFSYKFVNKIVSALIFLSMIYFYVTFDFFLSGKIILIFIFTLLWVISLKINMKILLIIIIILFLNFTLLIPYINSNTSLLPVMVSYKLSQITSIFNFDLSVLANTQTSMGNIVAEVITSFENLSNNLLSFVFGYGMGGAIEDSYGYLASWVDAGGYATDNYIRNQYFKMHLPVIEVFVKLGAIGVVFYTYMLTQILKGKSFINLTILIMLFFIFYTSKENLLLTLILIQSVKHYKNIYN